MPSENQAEYIKLLAAIVTAVGMMILVPLQGWTLSRVVEHGERLTAVEQWTKAFVREGPRYTADDAVRDLGVVMRLLENTGRTLEDHEGRLRIVEKQKDHL
jgi:hypothetical protein